MTFANKLKLETILFSEHSRSSSKKWFSKFSKEVKKNQNKKNKCKLLVGTEVKIKEF